MFYSNNIYVGPRLSFVNIIDKVHPMSATRLIGILIKPVYPWPQFNAKAGSFPDHHISQTHLEQNASSSMHSGEK